MFPVLHASPETTWSEKQSKIRLIPQMPVGRKQLLGTVVWCARDTEKDAGNSPLEPFEEADSLCLHE